MMTEQMGLSLLGLEILKLYMNAVESYNSYMQEMFLIPVSFAMSVRKGTRIYEIAIESKRCCYLSSSK